MTQLAYRVLRIFYKELMEIWPNEVCDNSDIMIILVRENWYSRPPPAIAARKGRC